VVGGGRGKGNKEPGKGGTKRFGSGKTWGPEGEGNLESGCRVWRKRSQTLKPGRLLKCNRGVRSTGGDQKKGETTGGPASGQRKSHSQGSFPGLEKLGAQSGEEKIEKQYIPGEGSKVTRGLKRKRKGFADAKAEERRIN